MEPRALHALVARNYVTILAMPDAASDTDPKHAQTLHTTPDHGLICGFEMLPDSGARPLHLEGAAFPVSERGVVWLHFNGAHAGARRWLAQTGAVPAGFLRLIDAHESRVQVSAGDDHLIGVLPDLAYGEAIDPAEVVTVWFYAAERVLVTARNHASRTVDRVRQSARDSLTAVSGTGLLAQLLMSQTEVLHEWLGQAASALDHAEDQILIGDVTQQRATVGRTRRLAMHLRRHFTPLRVALQRLLTHSAERRGGIHTDTWRTLLEEVGFVVDEASGVYERAKLLQEELASRLAEATSNNLFVLTVTTIVFLPMTLITGIFGMNVQGMPGVGDHAATSSFWWVMLLIVFAGAITFLLIRLRRLF
jgi:zinc transporter